jgi:hypothetical protein|nr:MAG TPA: hypothetical protein [Crassvirales sp.]
MVRRKLKTINSRPKALFGSEEAAILGAAGINVAGQMAAAAINSKAAKDAARQQAQATVNAATKQANALKEQTNKSKDLQERSIEFTKEQNAENRELQRDIQLNLQMLTGQQNMNDRLEASKIQVRNGGRMSMKSTNGQSATFLRGSYSPTNMPFVVTDGGGVVPVGVTPEGFDMYEIKGNDHEHYHKTKSGKHKTGVGLKFANGKVIEGEGNQNGNQGEYVLVTPTDAMFISRHSIKGFNPAKAVNNGMNPLEAFVIQEQIKDANGISDSGKTDKRMIGGLTYDTSSFAQVPDLSRDGMAPIATGVAYGSINNMYNDIKAKNGTSVRKRLACGGRHKAPDGSSTNYGAWADWAGAGINALGNLGGAFITQSANKKAANLIANANMQAAGILSNAYRQMHGIDMSLINKDDYATAHSMPAIRAAIVNTNAQTAAEDRSLQRRLTNSKRYSMSGAAAQDRMSMAETQHNDLINNIESEANKIRESIKQGNAQRISDAARDNANRDAQANERYNTARLSLLQYNNNIENAKIAGVGQANADAIGQSGLARAQGIQAGATAFSSALAASAQGVMSTANGLRNERANRENILLNTDSRNKVDYLVANTSTAGNKQQAYRLWNAWKDSSNSNFKQYAKELAYAYNFF